MDLSSDNLNHDRVREIFPDIDFNSNTGFLAVTGGRHLELGDNIDNTPIIHVNEIEAIGEGSMSLAKFPAGQGGEQTQFVDVVGKAKKNIRDYDMLTTHTNKHN